MTDWIVVREPGARAIFIDQANARRVFRVRDSKIASAQKRDMRGLQITGRDHQLPHVAGVLELFRLGLAIQNERANADVAQGGKRSGRTRCFHPWERGELWN